MSTRTGVAARWRSLLDQLGPVAEHRALADPRRARLSGDAGQQHIGVHMAFVRVDPVQQRSVDLLFVALLDRAADDLTQARGAEVVIVPRERVRAHTEVVPDGLLVTDLPLGRSGPDLESLSVIAFVLERGVNVREIADSIESLGQVLDYGEDAAGSTAVSRTLVRRLDSLASTPGVTVAVAGTVPPSASVREGQPHHLLLAAATTSTGHVDLELDVDHRLVARGQDKRGVPWFDSDYVLVSEYRPSARRSEFRSLRALRQEHALVDIGLEPGMVADRETWTARASRMRQAARAQQIVARAIAGDVTGACDIFRLASGEVETDALIESLLTRIGTAEEYWAVDAALLRVTEDATETAGDATVRARDRLVPRLEELLGLRAPDSAPTEASDRRPIVLEVANGLVPYVDSNQDGGVFLDQLIPAMRNRIVDGTGATVPGIHVRGNSELAATRFQVQIDEVAVLDANVVLDRTYAVLPWATPVDGVVREVTNVDPSTGARGAWLLELGDGGHTADDPGGDDERRLTTPTYIIHRVELALRAHLARLFGPQQSALLLDDWIVRGEGPLVTATVPDRVATLRLTWLLQSLLDEAVPISDLPVILRTVQEAGGIVQPLRTLRRAVRLALRDQLPRPADAASFVEIAREHDDALLASSSSTHVAPIDVVDWVRRTVDSHGPDLCLVARTSPARERLAVVARAEHPFVTTMTVEERGPVS